MTLTPEQDALLANAFESHERLCKATQESCSTTVTKLASMIISALSEGQKVIWMGNGGSAADCQHLAAEFVGRFTRERSALPSIALTVDTSILTAIGNDYGFDAVFSRQIEALANQGDVVIGISTSGNSPNVLNAMLVAKEKGCVTVAFTGETGGKLAPLCDLTLKIPSKVTARIQEMHILCGHILCDIAEEALAHVKC